MKKFTMDSLGKMIVFVLILLFSFNIILIEAIEYYEDIQGEFIIIEDEPIPLAASPGPSPGAGSITERGNWYIVNLLFALITTVFALATLELNFRKPQESRTSLNYICITVWAIFVSCSAVILATTANLSQPVFDIRAVWMVVITTGQFAALVCSLKLFPNTSVKIESDI